MARAAVITKVEDFEKVPHVMSAVYTHVVGMPPLGPFLYLSAAELSGKLAALFGVEAHPSLCAALFMRLWDVDQWRPWAAMYAPLDVQASSVATL